MPEAVGLVKGGTVHQMVKAGTLHRYAIRNSLFRLRDNRPAENEMQELIGAIYSLFLAQLKRGESLETFTFNWDVNPWKLTEVIRPQDWRVAKKNKYPKEFEQGKRVSAEEKMFTFQEPDMSQYRVNYRQHLKDGLMELKRETLRILRLPMDTELLNLLNVEEAEVARGVVIKEKAQEADYVAAETEMNRLMKVAQSRRRDGFDVDDVMAQMLAVSAKLKRA